MPAKGVECLRCYSVLFSIDDIIQHITDNPSHKWYKFGDEGVLFIKLLKEVNENEGMGRNDVG